MFVLYPYISLYAIDKIVILIAARSHSSDNFLSENRVVINSDFFDIYY